MGTIKRLMILLVSASLSVTSNRAGKAHRSTSTYEIVKPSTAEGLPSMFLGDLFEN